MSNTYVLVKFSSNWADEMDVEGFHIFTTEKWQKIEEEIREDEYPKEVYFGTNEENTYEEAEDFLGEFEVIPITKEEAATVKKLFGEYYGHWPF